MDNPINTTTNTQPDWVALAEMSADEQAVALAAFGYNDCGYETHDNAVGSLVVWAVHVAYAGKAREAGENLRTLFINAKARDTESAGWTRA